jgi:hypothetical protein
MSLSDDHRPAPQRCAAAHADDTRPCDGPGDTVRIVDRTGEEMAACPLHGAALFASLDGSRVYPLNGPDGSAIAAYSRARTMRPFDFTSSRSRSPRRAR